MTYIKTRDIFYVKTVLGHRNINNTLKYIHLAETLAAKSEDYICKVATTLEECTKLLEAGFEYITDYQDKKLFRKRK